MSSKIQTRLEKWFYKEDAVDMILGHLAILGLSPKRSTEPRGRWTIVKRVWNNFIICLFTVIVFVLSPITIYLRWGVNLKITTEIAGGMFVFGLVVVQIGCFLYQREPLENMVNALEDMRALGRLHRGSSKELLDARNGFTLIVMVFYTIASALAGAAFVVIPTYTWQKREFVARYWFPYDYKPSPRFELTAGVILLAATWGFHAIILGNALLLSIFAQTAYELRLLSYNIENVFSDSSEHERENGNKEVRILLGPSLSKITNWRKVKRYIKESSKRKKSKLSTMKLVDVADITMQTLSKVTIVGGFKKEILSQDKVQKQAELRFQQCLLHHQSITRLFSEVENAYTTILFCQYICVVCPVIIATILILFADVIDLKTLFFIGLMSMATGQQGFVCFLAEKVSEESEGVRDAVFGCNWYGASEKFKRSMQIIMSRSNQPLVLSPVGIPVTMETFHSVLKLTYSFYTSFSSLLGSSLQGHQ